MVIAGGSSGKEFRNAAAAAKQYGGNPVDFVKKSSSAYTTPDLQKISIHWVENLKTGARYEEKTIIEYKRFN